MLARSKATIRLFPYQEFEIYEHTVLFFCKSCFNFWVDGDTSTKPCLFSTLSNTCFL